MSILGLLLRSLAFHRRMHVVLGLGVVAATAVLTGALGVGDSMRGSLRQLTLDRLGRIDYVLATDRFFRAALAGELAAQPDFSTDFDQALSAILLTANMENPDSHTAHRANQVNLLGCDPQFWRLGDRPLTPPDRRQIVLNRPLAERLNVKVGDRVILWLPRITAIPSDSALGRKSNTVEGRSLTVAAVVPAKGLGRFSLRPSQQLPQNAYVPLDWLAEQLGETGGANVILVTGRSVETAPTPEADRRLARSVQAATGRLRPSRGERRRADTSTSPASG